MHQIKSSASPYLYEIKVDCEYKLTPKDVATFQNKVQRGVAVYGYTPNILISAASSYSYWDSLKLLLNVMDTGKLAICSDDEIDNIVSDLAAAFTGIKIKHFAKVEFKKVKEWITE